MAHKDTKGTTISSTPLTRDAVELSESHIMRTPIRSATILLLTAFSWRVDAQTKGKETYGGGTHSKLKGMTPEAMEWLQNQMEEMEEWWCVDQRMLGKAKLCDGYGKTELKEEKEIRSMMKPNARELNAMHEAYCGQFSSEQRKKAPVCILWDNRDGGL